MSNKKPNICVWKEENARKLIYKAQVNFECDVEKLINDIFKDWGESASGQDTKGNCTALYRKEFKSQVEFESWINKVSLPIEEIKYRAGKEKRVKLK